MSDFDGKKPSHSHAHHDGPASTDVADLLGDLGLMSAASAHKPAVPKARHDFVREITSKRANGEHSTLIVISKHSDDHVAEDSRGYIHGMLNAEFTVTAVSEFEVYAVVHLPVGKLNLEEHTAVLSPSRFPKAGAPVELKGDKAIKKDATTGAHAYWFDESSMRFGFTLDLGADDGMQAGMQGSLIMPDGDPHNFGPFTIVSVGPNESKAVTVSRYSQDEYEFVKEKIIHNHSALIHAPHKAAGGGGHKAAPARRLEF